MMRRALVTRELSEAFVNFISKLTPLYVQEMHDGTSCARSLRDGMLIRPIDESEEDADGRVEILWQAEPARRTVVNGRYMVELALVEYVKFHRRIQPVDATD